jgi:hypothetical protein
VSFAEDQGAVGEFGSGGECESLGEAVRSGTVRRNLYNVDTHVCQHGVERWRELTGSVAEVKPEFGGPVTKIHQKMTGLLSGPRAVREDYSKPHVIEKKNSPRVASYASR